MSSRSSNRDQYPDVAKLVDALRVRFGPGVKVVRMGPAPRNWYLGRVYTCRQCDKFTGTECAWHGQVDPDLKRRCGDFNDKVKSDDPF